MQIEPREGKAKVKVLAVEPSSRDDAPMGPGYKLELAIVEADAGAPVHGGEMLGIGTQRACGYEKFLPEGIRVGNILDVKIQYRHDEINGIDRFWISRA